MTSATMFPVPADATPADIFRTAADYIDRYGWYKGAFFPLFSPPQDKVSCPPACVRGAIRVAVCGWPARRGADLTPTQTKRILIAERLFADQLEYPLPDMGFTFNPDDTVRIRTVIEKWNDRDWRTVIEVTSELRAAADTYDRIHGGAR